MSEQDDRRIHARLQTHLEVKVDLGDVSEKMELRDLSQGGACLYCETSEPGPGDIVVMHLPGVDELVLVRGEVVRMTELDGGMLIGVRFTNPPEELGVVDYLLGVLLSGGGGGQRQYPRVAKRINVPCQSEDELMAVVENISLGGLALTVAQPLEAGESLLVVLPADDGEDLLSVHGHVVSCRELDDSDPLEFLVGLSFDDLSPQRRALLDAMLVSLLRQ